ncbi:hypothetical protein DQ04_13111000 [Trypanosoma grayi]|uniref:hypothetical protein n=1 Tax=Trypanosoma grayi TaxID=71804 RepID=UPI0004F40810|nr:hypothetical protein DQ04_13111000 [Trypanosoma grayi]KEG06602.1 hypothetical protein DQ04_13111000 [Trypanosoma grayi]
MMMRYVLFVCVLCVWCTCGCAAAGAEDEAEVTNNCNNGEATQCQSPQNPLPGGVVGVGGQGIGGGFGLGGAEGSTHTCPGDDGTILPCPEALDTGGDETPKGNTVAGQNVCTSPEGETKSGADNCERSDKLNAQRDNGSRIAKSTSINKEACEGVSDAHTCTSSSSLPQGSLSQSQLERAIPPGTGGGIGNVLLPGTGKPPGQTGPAGPAGEPGAKKADGEKEIDALDGKSLADCPAEGGDPTKCSTTPAPLKAQVQKNEPGEGHDSGSMLGGRGGSKISLSGNEKAQGTQPESRDDTVHSGSADGECGDGKLKETKTDCKPKDEDRSTQSDQREKDVLQTKNTQIPQANPKPDSPLDEKNDAKNSAASPPAPDSPKAESSADDRTNLEPAESTAQTAVEQSDAVQSQPSSSSASTSAAETTGSSPPTDKGQDPKAVDSSSGPVWVHAPPLLLLLSVMWLGGLAVTAVC